MSVTSRSIASAPVAGGSEIGRNIPDLRIHVLDETLAPVPIGVTGELYVAGSGLARGYLHRPGLTAERFVASPFGPEPGAYGRAGDLARRRADGTLEFLGRADQQVKVRGFRIEPGEIEATLTGHPDVTLAAVVAREHERDPADCYAVAPVESSAAALREWLAARLPDHMVPAHVVVLDRLPLTVNGKLDREALPPPPESHADLQGPLPQDEMTRLLAATWAGILGVERVSLSDNFFALGGHSLMATQVMSRVRRLVDVDLTVRALFEAPRFGDFVALVRDARRSGGRSAAAASSASSSLSRLGSYAQQRLWFIHQLQGTSTEYNMPQALRLRGELDVPALERSLNAIVERHEVLRTQFVDEDGAPGAACPSPRASADRARGLRATGRGRSASDDSGGDSSRVGGAVRTARCAAPPRASCACPIGTTSCWSPSTTSRSTAGRRTFSTASSLRSTRRFTRASRIGFPG